ncbi:Two-component response regulator-like APRR1 [Ananas comosus]|uniref:Two-component response regulator-like APRR1 n=1 Tax=Ananas comosus TaxID=4615 RepID=A0A199UZ33_ANACO|nr:Two-component response regulator-like APRR1 [Ananas comosus]
MGRDEGAAREAEAAAMGGCGSGGHRFLDRSKVRILLCDNDPKSSQEELHLLAKCSYQVTSVRSARQLIDVLRAQAADIDIILAEVDLPVAKGFKMLKYITRDKDLRRIPIIMMSSQDEVSVVVKCLRLGAADYLVKPLRTNELLNLWTHMWRRRRTVLNCLDLLLHCLMQLECLMPLVLNPGVLAERNRRQMLQWVVIGHVSSSPIFLRK